MAIKNAKPPETDEEVEKRLPRNEEMSLCSIYALEMVHESHFERKKKQMLFLHIQHTNVTNYLFP